MTSREQFEAWLSNTYEWANDTLDMAFFYGDDETGYYTGGDFIYDGSSCADTLFWAWRGWQASRDAVEVELPERQEYEDALSDSEIGFNRALEECAEAIRAAGIKVKGE